MYIRGIIVSVMGMGMERGFQIRHFSIHQGCGDDGVEWIDVNLIFSVDPEYRMYADGPSREWLRGILYEVDDPAQIINFYDEIPVGVLREQQHPAKRVGYVMNDDNYLIYLPKFDVYRFCDTVEDNRVTRAILRELGELHSDGAVVPSGRFVPISRLFRCLRALSTFWD